MKTEYLEYPYRDILGETREERINRVVSIGKKDLMKWWDEFKHYSFPSTYGDSGCSFAVSVAYMLENNGPTDWQVENVDILHDVIVAYDRLQKGDN